MQILPEDRSESPRLKNNHGVYQWFNPFCLQDYDFAKGKSEYEDILQCNNTPSSRTPRGHQFPAAFMILAAGLDKVRWQEMLLVINLNKYMAI